MNGKCFEIGTIQAFLDGETTPEMSLHLTGHVAACDNCARLMADADEENAIVFSTLERELNTLVPTQRLWSRINETIEVEKSQAPVWQKFLVYVRISLANPALTAAAGILLVLGIFTMLSLRNGDDVVFVNQPSVPPAPTKTEIVPVDTTGSDVPVPGSSAAATPSFTRSNLSDKQLRSLAQNVGLKAGQREIKPQNALYTTTAVDTYLPGEESYVKTISDLKQNVDSQKDAVMSPSSRISYERDMAMVNDSIKRMRDVVKKNPRSQSARQVLYSSYQDKIDLLNSVAQREELMASLR